ncbi:NFX1-type zinc finger-containing protein 1-like [Centruroides vittatus]|uniref:NFX1-type zinc finger-containing protein 1-like n=1 Tax=Centruroides vittatus TaxID=120091 RepID=UPI00350F789F
MMSEKNKKKFIQRPMGYKELKSLIEKDSYEILLTLQLKSFLELLSQPFLNKDKMALILTAVGKACKSNEREILSLFLKSIESTSNFTFIHLQKFLCNLQNNECEDFHINSLDYLIIFLSELQRVNPASDTLSIILPLLKTTVEKIARRNGTISSNLEEKIKELEQANDSFCELHMNQKKENCKLKHNEVVDPPNDFREIPILPVSRESLMEDPPFIRPIIQEGSYSSVDHYLDIQFRLLREDILRPLRNGIGEYLIHVEKSDKNNLHKNLKVYTNVFIKRSVMTASGLNYIISFDVKKFKSINWNNSKRLLFGSLLCLSHDNFQSIIFATVSNRNAENLAKGQLEIHFENSNKIFDFEPFTVFIMVESDAYFEAYYHVMLALQKMTEDTLPFKQYIVNCEKEVKAPKYLKKNDCYNFQSLMMSSDSANFEYAASIKVLDTTTWPSKDDIGLDDSQIKSLKMAMTKEIAIIQGPPGTGKTFIGLKIVQLLLNNCSVWNPSEELSPILIVCYTNHALDQFLEGILSFTNSIVRVGGRSSNQSLNAYQLAFLRQQDQTKSSMPHYLSKGYLETKLELKAIQREIINFEKKVENAGSYILSLNELSQFMSKEHFLKTYEDMSQYFDGNTIISEWLQFNDITDDVEKEYDQKELSDAHSLADMEDSDQEEIGDIDYITNERVIDDFEVDAETAGTSKDSSKNLQSELKKEANWLVKGKQNTDNQHKKIMKKLQETDIMTERQENECKNIWNLNVADRWRMYRLWVACYIDHYVKQIKSCQEKYKEHMVGFSKFKVLQNVELMKHAKIVGMTTTGASKYRSIVQKLKPKIVVVEEAAEVLEAHIVTSLTPDTEHLILIGDHQQLKPSPTVYELAKKYHLDLSFFERMINNGMQYEKLTIQHRMRPCISTLLVPYFYKHLTDHVSVKKYENIKGMDKNMFFVCHNYHESVNDDSKSRSNYHEAKFIDGLCKYLILQGYKPSQITILTMYTGQMHLLKTRRSPACKDVRITVVDNYQGEENDIILISFVRSNMEQNIGFLKVNNRVCVALSRAKKGLYCIGNFEFFADNSDIWKKIIEDLKESHHIESSLKLKCQNHPSNITDVNSASDFVLKAPEGGCDQLCNFRLDCGHSCTVFCHPYDQEHKDFKCKKPCQRKICKYKHCCKKKCFETCGPCLELVPKRLPSCNHIMKIFCYQEPEDVICNVILSKELQCGHICKVTCGSPFPVCQKLLNCRALCGHNVKVECKDSKNEWKKLKLCQEVCNTELECGHICRGKCNECQQGRLHVICAEKCKRVLVCGHECQFPCAENCPPCTRKCENSCKHSKCPKICGQQCKICKEECSWKCEHYRCKQLCGELCDRPPCNKACHKILKCGHECIGLCGEPCPKLCRICNHDKVTEIFFGTEDEEDARFIQLEDCGHIFEITGFTQMLEMSSNSTDEIQMKSCPLCKKVIRKSLRFGNHIKACLKGIELVKEKIRGFDNDNERKKQSLIEKIDKFRTENEHVIFDMVTKLQSRSTVNVDTKVIYRVTSNINKILLEEKQMYRHLLDSLENFLNFLNDIFDFCNKLLLIYNRIQNIETQYSLFWEFVLNCIIMILKVMEENSSCASYHLLCDINREINRLKFFTKLFRITTSMNNPDFIRHYRKAVQILTIFKTFDDDIYKKADKKLNELARHCDGAVLGISDIEKRAILKAMDLRQGHWFQCPNGHIYCITECGGAMEEGKCNECGLVIGGSQHRLRQDNRVASVMDGSRHAAWSEHANLNNFMLDDI